MLAYVCAHILIFFYLLIRYQSKFDYMMHEFGCLSGPPGFYLLDFFCSGIQFYLLLSPYFCFISLLYLDLYVLADNVLIS